jgi:two-component system, NarL family, sensor histidine kinase UhpB
MQLSSELLVRELHDNIAQSLSAINLLLQSLIEQADYPADSTREMLRRIHTTSRTANAELRQLLDSLAKPSEKQLSKQASLSPQSQNLVAVSRLQRLGLVQSLKEFFAHSLARSCKLELQCETYAPQSLEREVELFRVTQETVSNAVRHGGATWIVVTLKVDDNTIALNVIDNGSGLIGKPEGIGIASMRARIARLGGQFELRPISTGGVRVQVSIPR